jgi:hypothetical protein
MEIKTVGIEFSDVVVNAWDELPEELQVITESEQLMKQYTVDFDFVKIQAKALLIDAEGNNILVSTIPAYAWYWYSDAYDSEQFLDLTEGALEELTDRLYSDGVTLGCKVALAIETYSFEWSDLSMGEALIYDSTRRD